MTISRDDVVFLGLVISFATLATAHVTLVAGLAARRPRWRAPVALVVLPLALWWGRAERMHARTVTWLVSAGAYVALLWMASR